MFKEFRDFALKGNVLDMAVGIIIGAAFTTIVKSLVDDIMMPPIGALMGGVDFSDYFIALTLAENGPATVDAAKAAGVPVIAYGKFINALLQFSIVAFALFLVIKQMNALKARIAKGEAPPPSAPPRQEVLLEEIRDALRAKN
ncbi:large conductance mechanosensitive channel protein MscL [Parvibaculum sp.]|uniref:large conductance mechanosensitive channel protein MscL n=1 Tax=Parvibaculum sp. TaxID=2024848 RepID=UPI000CC359C5|nr:large conductance mechanosensitive channel protein MscL [Parvibaculum sp.]MBX3490531.1 large conductance mechanosensitive channel protein MscL [Parvibaculum sp.]PKQ05880.1 MAG: large conductance mechanosensitive channel protein MscL [Alphaproteobacteria bacterium HGW-Alphaproteobacteria-11]